MGPKEAPPRPWPGGAAWPHRGASPGLSAGVFRCSLSPRAGPGETPSAGFRVWPGSVPVIASLLGPVSPPREAAAWETAGRPQGPLR